MGKNDTQRFDFFQTEKKLKGGLLRSIAISLIVVSVGFILLSGIALPEIFQRVALIGGMVSSSCLLVLWMIPRGSIRIAGIILIFTSWLIISVMTFTAGGVTAPIFIGNFIIIFLAATLLGTTAGIWALGISILSGVGFVIADMNNLLPPDIEYPLFARLAIYTFFFIVTFLLQRTAVRTTTEAILRASITENEYRLFLENIPSITYINDLSEEARTTYISPQVEKLLGYSQSEFLEDPLLWTKIIVAEDCERVLAENHRTSITSEPFNIEYRLIKKDKNIVWMRDEATLVYDAKNNPLYWLGIWTEITSAKGLEAAQSVSLEALTKRTNQLQTASEISSAATSILDLNELLSEAVELIRSHFDYYYVGLFLVDADFKILSLRAATGEVGEEMLNNLHSFEIGNSSMVGWCASNNKARIALDVGQDAVRFKNPLLPLTRSELALPLRARGRVIGAISFQSIHKQAFTESDITALQTMTDQVANAIETARLFDERVNLIKELEAKNAELEQFAYTVSHDLKSPLVTMRGYLGYLSDSARKGDFARFDADLERVINATNTMQALLNDLLNLSRVGRIEEAVENVNINEVIKKILDLVHNIYADKRIQIEVGKKLPNVRVNQTRLREVIQNLLVNAMKFSAHQPTPRVEIGADGFDSASKFPIFFVRDNGVGIDPQYHKQIFGLFNRLDNDIEGTGVGLTLVKRIIEMYGGKIWIESDGQGNGSTFYFTLPPVN